MSMSDMNHVPAGELASLTEALEAAGIYTAVEQRDGSLIISGEVDSTGMHDAAIDLAQLLANRHDLRVEDAIDVLDIDVDLGDVNEGIDIVTSEATAYTGDASSLRDVGTNDAYVATEEGIPYFPPTDPVIAEPARDNGDIDVIGGFQTTSLQGDEDEASGRRIRGDEQISDDIRRELLEDASTTDLRVRVETRGGVAFLLGEVPSLEDAENAEAVAARVPGVREVREDLTVLGLKADRRR